MVLIRSPCLFARASPGQQHAKAVKTGKPSIGGPFKLLDQDGKEFTEKDLRGGWSLLYFGFTNCPDICPEELDKMSDVVDVIDKKYGPVARPIFVSCDPARDSVAAVKKYVAGSSLLWSLSVTLSRHLLNLRLSI